MTVIDNVTTISLWRLVCLQMVKPSLKLLFYEIALYRIFIYRVVSTYIVSTITIGQVSLILF